MQEGEGEVVVAPSSSSSTTPSIRTISTLSTAGQAILVQAIGEAVDAAGSPVVHRVDTAEESVQHYHGKPIEGPRTDPDFLLVQQDQGVACPCCRNYELALLSTNRSAK